MSVIRQVLLGAAVCTAGFAAIYAGLERMPQPEPIARSDGGKSVDVAAAESAESAAAAEPAESAPAEAPAQPTAGGDTGLPANAALRINEAGLAIIKESEGLRLEAYELSGRWYIGYGHSGATPGSTITEAQAEALLREDVGGAEAGVRRLVAVPVNANEFSAMVSLAYNLGVGGFGRSSVLAKLNAGDRTGAADAFLVHVRAGYQVLEHLKHRREKERALFLTPA